MSLHPDFPVVEGRFRLTSEWELYLPARFNRRIDEGNMVIWRPALTFWISIWGNETGETMEQTLAWILEDASPDRTEESVERTVDLIRLTYKLREQDPDRETNNYVAISGYVISPSGHVQISAYCDDAESETMGHTVIGSVRKSPDIT